MRTWFNNLLKPANIIALIGVFIAAFVAFSGAIDLSPKKVQELNADNECTVNRVKITSNSNNSSELKVNCDNSTIKDSTLEEKSN